MVKKLTLFLLLMMLMLTIALADTQVQDDAGLFTADEIAEITGCGPEAIRSNLSRARKKVRDVYLRTIQERKERRNEP